MPGNSKMPAPRSFIARGVSEPGQDRMGSGTSAFQTSGLWFRVEGLSFDGLLGSAIE